MRDTLCSNRGTTDRAAFSLAEEVLCIMLAQDWMVALQLGCGEAHVANYARFSVFWEEFEEFLGDLRKGGELEMEEKEGESEREKTSFIEGRLGGSISRHWRASKANFSIESFRRSLRAGSIRSEGRADGWSELEGSFWGNSRARKRGGPAPRWKIGLFPERISRRTTPKA